MVGQDGRLVVLIVKCKTFSESPIKTPVNSFVQIKYCGTYLNYTKGKQISKNGFVFCLSSLFYGHFYELLPHIWEVRDKKISLYSTSLYSSRLTRFLITKRKILK